MSNDTISTDIPMDHALGMLRLRLRRHILWLRHRWGEATQERYQGLAVSDGETDRLLDEIDVWRERAAFFQADPAAVALTELLEPAARGPEKCDVSLRELQDLFGLSDFERDCVLLAVAVELDSGFERLFAYAQDDAGLLMPTPGLALALFCNSSEDALRQRAAFISGAPLFKCGLIEWAAPGRGGMLTRPFRIDERILGFLIGRQDPDSRIAGVVTIAEQESPAVEGWREQADALEHRIRAFLDDEAGQGRRLIISLRGDGEGNRKALAARVCQRVGLPLICARLTDLLGSALVGSALLGPGLAASQATSLFFREALLLSAATCLEMPEGVGEGTQGETTRQILRGIADYSPLTFVSSETPWPSTPMNLVEFRCARVELVLPPLDYAMRRRLWEEGLGGVGNGRDVSAFASNLANRFQFDPEQISLVIEKARQAAVLEGRHPVSADIEVACRTLPVHGLGSLAQKVASPFSWEDIVLPEDTLEQLREITRQFRFREKVYGDWRFEKKLDRGRGTCVLFSGPSGTGKTMAAGILANDLGLDLYRIDLSGVVSKYIGETEKNLRRVFDEGEKSQAILFFDEADALFGKRSEVKDSHDRYANIEINYLLQRMENYTGASILATNMRSSLDTAFMRRLRYIVEFPMPDTAYRETIWRKSFPPEAAIDGVDFRFLAKNFAMSGGNIMNVAVNSAFMAAADGGRIGMTHLVQAVKREYAKLGKLCLESEFGKYL